MIRSPAGFDGGDRIKRYLDYYQPSYGVMMLSAGQFSPALLFAAGEQGFWFDGNDMSTMFQDAAGTTPVTAVEQVVRLWLDKSGRGNNATSTTPPTLSGRYNLLLATTTLATQNVTTIARDHVLRFVGAGTITLSGTATGTYSAGTHTITCTAGTLTLTVAGSVTSADFRLSNDGVGLPSYQRVTSATDYDVSGFPLFLRFNGSSTGMATSAINFSGSDKITVWAALRKISDAQTGIVAELSANAGTNNGAFFMSAPASAATASYNALSRGTVNAIPSYTNALVAAPVSNVVTLIGDISGDRATLRVNGTQVNEVTTDQGTGNYGNYAVNIGARNAAATPSLRLNSRLYGLIGRSTAASAAQITNTESWMDGQYKLY